MNALRTWESAAHIALVQGFTKAEPFYNTAKDELQNDGAFLFNYGQRLSKQDVMTKV